MRYVFLSTKFYQQYNSSNYPEIEQKIDRPYVMLIVKIDNLTFAIPFRSHIKHQYAFMTDKINACGIDYSKAVIVLYPDYIDNSRTP